MIRLYGHTHGEGSFTQVTRGVRRALEHMGVMDGFVSVDWNEPDTEEPSGCDTFFSLNCGNPVEVRHACIASHTERWVLVAPNSEGLPPGLIEPLRKNIHGILAPSEWARQVMDDVFEQELPVGVTPHGIMPEIHAPNLTERMGAMNAYCNGEFRVLHLTSTDTDRKGTRELVKAWAVCKRDGKVPERALLVVVASPLYVNHVTHMLRAEGLSPLLDAVVIPGLTLSQKTLAMNYSSAHIVCQPSRAEGFGMVPLEARACGVPVVATGCTGHSEHVPRTIRHGMEEGCVVIPHGPSAPIEDYAGARAPTIATEDIIECLDLAYSEYKLLHAVALQRADSVRKAWAWETIMAPGITRLLNREKDPHVRHTDDRGRERRA